MKTTNNTIFENIHERGYMTEKEMLLLKKRSNAAQHDLFNYDAFPSIFHYLKSGQIKASSGLNHSSKRTANQKRGKTSEIGRLKS